MNDLWEDSRLDTELLTLVSVNGCEYLQRPPLPWARLAHTGMRRPTQKQCLVFLCPHFLSTDYVPQPGMPGTREVHCGWGSKSLWW